MTFSTEQFLARSNEPKHADEAKLASAYVAADRNLGEARISLISHISAEKKGEKFIPVFDSGVKECIPALTSAEEKAASVGADVSKYLELLRDQPSVAAMTEQLGRIRIVVRNSEFSAKSVLDQTVKASKKTSGEAMVDPKVVDGYAKAERLSKENQPAIDDLLARIREARQILEKY